MVYPKQTGNNNSGAFALAYWISGWIGEGNTDKIRALGDKSYKVIQFDGSDFLNIDDMDDKAEVVRNWAEITGGICTESDAGEFVASHARDFRTYRNICLQNVKNNYCNPVSIMKVIRNKMAECRFCIGYAAETKMVYAQLRDTGGVEKAAFDYNKLEAGQKALEIVTAGMCLHYLYVFMDENGMVMAADPADGGKAVERKSLCKYYKTTGAAIIIQPVKHTG